MIDLEWYTVGVLFGVLAVGILLLAKAWLNLSRQNSQLLWFCRRLEVRLVYLEGECTKEDRDAMLRRMRDER